MTGDNKKRQLCKELPFCTAYGNRTRDSSVKGMRLNPLTNAALSVFGSAKIMDKNGLAKKKLKNNCF